MGDVAWGDVGWGCVLAGAVWWVCTSSLARFGKYHVDMAVDGGGVVVVASGVRGVLDLGGCTARCLTTRALYTCCICKHVCTYICEC